MAVKAGRVILRKNYQTDKFKEGGVKKLTVRLAMITVTPNDDAYEHTNLSKRMGPPLQNQLGWENLSMLNLCLEIRG